MKPLLNGLALLILILTTHTLIAQVHPAQKRAMFDVSASQVTVAVSELEKTLVMEKGAIASLKFNGLTFNGTVINSVKKYDNLHTVIIKNSETNSLLSFSKRINDDGTVTYIGRIFNERSTDGYELKKDAEGNYTFYKIETEELIQDY